MFQKIGDAVKPSTSTSLAPAFRRLGWAGFWLQVIFGSFPIVLMLFYLVFSPPETSGRSGPAFVEYLTIVSLLMLVFTTIWSYRYTRFAKRLMDPDRRPSQAQVTRTVWTGVVASAGGMVFSMIVMLIEAGTLLFYFLKAPQAGVAVVQTTGAANRYSVTTGDMVSLMALILTLFAELIVLVFSLWLLFRTTLASPEFPHAGEQA